MRYFAFPPTIPAQLTGHVCFRSLVLWLDSDTASAGEHLRVRERCGQRRAELHELPDGSAPLHHGDLRSTAAALRHLSHHLCLIHHHRPHHVLPVRAQSQEKTSPRHIRSKHGPHFQAWEAHQHWLHSAPVKWMSPSCSSHSTPDLAIHFSTTQRAPVPPLLLSSCRAYMP